MPDVADEPGPQPGQRQAVASGGGDGTGVDRRGGMRVGRYRLGKDLITVFAGADGARSAELIWPPGHLGARLFPAGAPGQKAEGPGCTWLLPFLGPLGFYRLPVRLPAGQPAVVQHQRSPPPLIADSCRMRAAAVTATASITRLTTAARDSGGAVSRPALSIHTAVTLPGAASALPTISPVRGDPCGVVHRTDTVAGPVLAGCCRSVAIGLTRRISAGTRCQAIACARGLHPGGAGGLVGIGGGDGAADHQQGQHNSPQQRLDAVNGPPHRTAVPPPQRHRDPPGTPPARSHHGHP